MHMHVVADQTLTLMNEVVDYSAKVDKHSMKAIHSPPNQCDTIYSS